MIAIAIISNKDKPSGWLTSMFAGSAAYHIGFVDTESMKLYDQNLLFRRRLWPHYPREHVKLYQCPVPVTSKTLEYELDTSIDVYGLLDYISFAFKGLFLNSRPSFKGVICSEKVEQILIKCGWTSPFVSFVPSPTDFERVLIPL